MFNTLETHEKLKYPRCTMGDDYSRELSRLATVQKTGHMHLKTRATHTTTKWLATDLELPSQPPPPKETTTTTTTTTQDGKIVLRLTWSMFGVSGVHGCRVSRETNKASQQTMPAHPTQGNNNWATFEGVAPPHIHTSTQRMPHTVRLGEALLPVTLPQQHLQRYFCHILGAATAQALFA